MFLFNGTVQAFFYRRLRVNMHAYKKNNINRQSHKFCFFSCEVTLDCIWCCPLKFDLILIEDILLVHTKEPDKMYVTLLTRFYSVYLPPNNG